MAVERPGISREAAGFLAALPPVEDLPDFPMPDDVEGWLGARAVAEANAEPLEAIGRTRCPFETTECAAGPLPALTIRTAQSQPDRIAIYLHGGAYTLHSARSTALSGAQMAEAASATVVSIDYPLAPEQTAKMTVPAVAEAIAAIAAEAGRPIGLFGESAGAGLATAAVRLLASQDADCPAAVVLMSPWADLTASGSSYVGMGGRDAVFEYERMLVRAAQAYAGTLPLEDPLVSPALATYSDGFPPVLIQAGTDELMLSDAELLHAAFRRAGVSSKLMLFGDMFHAFQVFLRGVNAPEAVAAYKQAASFLDRRVWSRHGA